MNKSFKYNEHLEKYLTAIFGLLGMVAIFINIHLKGYGSENWLDAIKDLAGLIVVLAVFIASVRIGSRSKSFTEVAKSKLEILYANNKDFLIGPRYNRDNYNPEIGQGLEYLFITNNDIQSKSRAKFIPIQPLEEGVLVIYVQKGTLVYGLNYTSEQATPEEIKKVQDAVKNAVFSLVQRKYTNVYEEVTIKERKDSAVIIDFDENVMGKHKFGKAINECVECAIKTLKDIRDHNVNLCTE